MFGRCVAHRMCSECSNAVQQQHFCDLFEYALICSVTFLQQPTRQSRRQLVPQPNSLHPWRLDMSQSCGTFVTKVPQDTGHGTRFTFVQGERVPYPVFTDRRVHLQKMRHPRRNFPPCGQPMLQLRHLTRITKLLNSCPRRSVKLRRRPESQEVTYLSG